MDKKSSTASRRRKKANASDFDAYVANVSNGHNPPSQAKRRRKKKPDPDAYDRFLEESEPKQSRRSRREQAEQLSMELDAPAPKPKKKAKAPRKVAKRKDDYDAYLLELEASEELLPGEPGEYQRRQRRKQAKRRKKQVNTAAGAAYVAVMAILLAGFCAYGWNQVQQYRKFQGMREVVDSQRFYDGTTVDGYDVSGMTLEEAEDFFAASVEPMYSGRSVTLTTGEMYLAEQLGYTSNYEQVLHAAWSSGRSGTLEERYAAVVSGAHAAENYSVTRTFYTEETVRSVVSEIASRVSREPSDPQVTGFDVETLSFTFDEGQVGQVLDEEKLVSDIMHVMGTGGGDVETLITAIQPTITAEEVASQYGRISFISTSASTSKAARITNLTLACQAINGYRLDPGKEFSFNGVVGQRTAEKGYQVAGVYSSGAAGQGIGGGICQVGSTLFNAAVMADMEITQRAPHSLPVHYLDLGRDAAINWPNQDLKFVNNGDAPVYIVARVTSDKQVECAIYGKYLPDGKSIAIESKRTATITSETVQKLDTSLPSGTTKVVEGHNGYKATAWKIWLDADGNEISREVLCYSTYGKADTVVYYNP